MAITNTPDQSLNDRVAEELRAELARQRKTGSWLARELGVSGTWVNQRLAGNQPIAVDELELIASKLGVPVGRLIPTEPNPGGAR
jgi:transcriptional regulator with XRE-family HTH domain